MHQRLDEGKLSFTLHEDKHLRLSEFEAALGELDIQVDRQKLTLPVYFDLTLKGIANDKTASELEDALKKAAIVESFELEFDKPARRVAFRARAKDRGATYTELSKIIEKANGSAKVEDMTWAGACPGCRQAGMKQAACPKCWPEGT